MNLSFYTAAVGAQQQQLRLDVHANNIANVNTYGFRAKIPAFSSLMTGFLEGIEDDIPRGVGAKLEDAETDFRGSTLTETGRALDYAIEGDGFFALEDPDTGEITYTRDGSFIMSLVQSPGEEAKEWMTDAQTSWYLTDGNGRFVLDVNGNRIELHPYDWNSETRELELSDTLTAPGNPLPIGIWDFNFRNGMRSGSENRLTAVDKDGEAYIRQETLLADNTRIDSTVNNSHLIQGSLELSNTDLANEMAKVIEAQRSFTYMLRMVTTSDEIETTVNGLR